jgi:putative transposase
MEQQGVRKTYQYNLKPTPQQERTLEWTLGRTLGRTLMLCRQAYNAASGERREAWRRRGVSITY